MIDGVEQAPLEPPSQPFTGDSHAHLIEPMRAFAESLGFTVSFEELGGPAGDWRDASTSGSSSTPTSRPTPDCGR